jgi:NAD(P)H-dependent FMN reductase
MASANTGTSLCPRQSCLARAARAAHYLTGRDRPRRGAAKTAEDIRRRPVGGEKDDKPLRGLTGRIAAADARVVVTAGYSQRYPASLNACPGG